MKSDLDLLPAVVAAAHAAGERLLALFDPAARPADRGAMFALGRRNEEASLGGLREALTALRPAAWLEGDGERKPLPPGEHWVVDAVEGNVNHLHGVGEWAVTVALVRDDMPVLAVVRQPVGDLTYAAVRGHGAFANGAPLRVSAKRTLDAAIAATGQAEADEPATPRRLGASIAAMLARALLVRATVPSTFPLLRVAAGQHDVFWIYEPVLPGVAPGMLLVTEAGGTATRLDGSPWRPGAPDLLVTNGLLHGASVDVLRGT
jgi:myo-inositol-1(or 4)-monophosphatase